jgi:site-specific DNA recombinase
MKKVAIYARVSTALQEQEKTIESQLAELREICKDLQIVKEYIDDGWSGETLDRPALDQLRNDTKEGLFEAVYVHSVDRFSRNLYQQGILVEELKKGRVEIFINGKPIADTPEGRFMFNVLGAAAEYEKEKILERTRRGRIYKAKQKGIVGNLPPFGYNYTKKTVEKEGYFTINKKEAEIVNLIFNLYIEFQSITRVQKELTLRGINPRKNREKWCRSTIRTILRNGAYIGIGYYNKYRSVETENGKKYRKKIKNGRILRERDEWIPIKYPVIVDENEFKFAQEILSKKYKPFGKNKYFYLLSGLIRCANCGSTFTGCESGGNFYYRCSNRRKRLPFPQDCRVSHMRRDNLDSGVWEVISEAIMNPKILIAHISHLANEINEGESILKEEKDKLLQEKNCVIIKKRRLDDLYFKEFKSIEEYQEQMSEFNQEENKINEEIEEIERKLTQVINRPLILKNIQYFCNLAKQKLQALNLEQKQQFLRYLIDEITLDSNKKKAKIIGYVPIETQGFDRFFTQINLLPEQIGALSILWKVFASQLRKGKLPF